MTPKLNKRVQIQQATQTPADSGLLELTYTTIKTIWAEVKNIERSSLFAMSVRGVNTQEGKDTHQFRIRANSLYGIGNETSKAFASAFVNMQDINQAKSNYFLFLQHGSTVKGRRFRIRGMQLDESHAEYIRIFAEEIEEEGTGWPR
jgi:head-tail adaptor